MYNTASLLIVGLAVVAGLPQDAQSVIGNTRTFQCPEDDGVFEDDFQCDKYWICEQGIAKAKLCDDGLVFDIFKANAGHADPCESPYVVDCGTRHELQDATFPSDACPRRHGIFADPDPTICHRYFTCINGHATATDCSSGLHFDENSGNCAWPATAGRTGCNTKIKACVGDFCCTGEEVLSADGVVVPHPTFPNDVDCQKFWVCLGGTKPQESSCSLGQVYNEKSTLCDYPENVPECTGWYKDHPQFADYYEYDENVAASNLGSQDVVAG